MRNQVYVFSDNQKQKACDGSDCESNGEGGPAACERYKNRSEKRDSSEGYDYLPEADELCDAYFFCSLDCVCEERDVYNDNHEPCKK